MEHRSLRKFVQIPTSTVREHLDNSTNYEVGDAVESKTLMMATHFTDLMDNPHHRSGYILSEDAVMDWFGRSLLGRDSIIGFVRANLPKMHHEIEGITGIPRINHRLMKHFINGVSHSQNKPFVEECGQGDCKGKSTPMNTIHSNLEKLVRAPSKKKYQCNSDPRDWQFLEIKGQLEFDYELGLGTSGCSKSFKRIVLGYTDEVHLIVYEHKNFCRKKLFPLFAVPDQ